jgi:DNA-binding response OmpR family regulator
MAKIILIEDDPLLLKNIREWLEIDRHIVEVAVDGESALDLLRAYTYDAIILDWMLPGLTGLAVLKQFREFGGATPVLFLTGKDQIEDKEMGLDAGADDYLTKPFHMKELLARLRALLRRSRELGVEILRIRELEIDLKQHTVTRKGELVTLMRQEYALLEFLARHPNHLFSAESLIERVWHAEREITPKAVRTYITRLRAKLDRQGEDSVIVTVHGVGYKLIGG